MKFTQYYLDCLSQASYLIADETTKQAVVVDPRRDVAEYLADANEHGLTIDLVIDTHFHADFLAGHLELAAPPGAWIGFGQRAEADFPIRKLADGERIPLGDVTLEILETPGHTPESISVAGVRARRRRGALRGAHRRRAVHRRRRPARPAGLDRVHRRRTRPACCTPRSTAADGPARRQVRVFPAHGAGSACGKNLSTERRSTIGEQHARRTTPANRCRRDVRGSVTEGQPAAPDYFVYDAMLNRKDRELLDETKLPTA